MEPPKLFVAVCAVVLGEWMMTEYASSQPLIPLAPPPPPIFNPSSPSTIPQTSGTPVSPNAPGVLQGSGVQRGSSFCGVFHRGRCFPEYLPPIGQDLRLTIVSTDENDPASKADGDAINELRGDKADDEKNCTRFARCTPHCALAGCRRQGILRVTAWNTLFVLPSNAMARLWQRPASPIRATRLR